MNQLKVGLMKKVFTVLSFIAIIGAGVGAMTFFSSQKTEAERQPVQPKATIVSAVEARVVSERALVSVMGTVVPARSVTIVPEVAGKIVGQGENLVPGGRFKKGQTVVRIDPRDYELALEQQRARVAQAGVELATEKGRKAVAEREWSLIKDQVTPTEEGRRLALHEIQMETAEAALSGAQSALQMANLSRSRTVIKAPFNALVTEEFVDVGQVVGPGTRIATLVDSDYFWVRTSVPLDRLAWIRIPGTNGKEGSRARIVQQIGDGAAVEREGKVVKLLGDLDPVGKMARVLVEVSDPLGSESADEEYTFPLLLGAHVSVQIEGPVIDDVVAIPTRALREGGQVWVKKQNELGIEDVEVVWTMPEEVFVRGAIQPGDQIITSRIAAPVVGMSIRFESEKPLVTDAGPLPSETPETQDSAKEKK
jgi:RND family efflux transporter MFP subunit